MKTAGQHADLREGVYILGIGATPVGRYPDRSFTDLLGDAFTAAVEDAELADIDLIEGIWFSSTLMDFWGQRLLRGQESLLPLIQDGTFPNGRPIVNVEGGCASASVAFNGAWSAILRGCDVALALGVEKMNHESRPGADILSWMEGGGGQLHPELYWGPYEKLAAELGVNFQPQPGRSFAMDVYSLLAMSHMRRYGTTAAHIAAAAAKNHTAATGNPRGQYKFPMTVDDVLNDRQVVEPLTRAMCAPRGDGAAAVLVCSHRFLAQQPPSVRERALLVRGHTVAGGSFGAGWEDERAPARSAARTYDLAGVEPSDLDLVEVHDATSFAEIHLVEDLGLCSRGEGGPFTVSGATQPDGAIPVNPSGGLVARGHPIGATGIMMLNEVALQLRGEAGDIQVADARVGLAENGGGILGLDVAVCSTTILERLA